MSNVDFSSPGFADHADQAPPSPLPSPPEAARVEVRNARPAVQSKKTDRVITNIVKLVFNLTHFRQATPTPQASPAAGPSISQQVTDHSEKITASFNLLEKSLVKLAAVEAKLVENPNSQADVRRQSLLQAQVAAHRSDLCKSIVDVQKLPTAYQNLVVKSVNLQVMGSGGSFAFDRVLEDIKGAASEEAELIEDFIGEVSSVKSATLNFSARTPAEKGNVTLVCALAVDGMGDLGLAMNALSKVDDSKANAKLVVLVGIADEKTQPFMVEQQRQQLAKVEKMVGENPNIEIVKVPLSPHLWGPGPPSLCQSKMSDSYDKLAEIFGKTDVLMTVPVKYIAGADEVKDMLPKDSKFMLSTEYGLRDKDSEGNFILDPSVIETGPLKTVYINEGRRSREELFEILSNDPEVAPILPFANDVADKQASFDSYSTNNNLALFYLNPATPKTAVKAFFEHYMDIHKSDERNLNVVGNIPDEFFDGKKSLTELKKKYNVDEVVIHHKGEEPITKVTTSHSGNPPKVLHIYAGYGFKKSTFEALSEFGATTAGKYPNLFFAAGDGSFTDALSLMVNYSSNPERSDAVVSLPVYLARLDFHKKTVADFIELCGQIGEPEIKRLFEQYRDIETLSPNDREALTQLAASPEVKFGLARVCRFLSTEHNLSRDMREHINDAVNQVLQAKAQNNPEVRSNIIANRSLLDIGS